MFASTLQLSLNALASFTLKLCTSMKEFFEKGILVYRNLNLALYILFHPPRTLYGQSYDFLGTKMLLTMDFKDTYTVQVNRVWPNFSDILGQSRNINLCYAMLTYQELSEKRKRQNKMSYNLRIFPDSQTISFASEI